MLLDDILKMWEADSKLDEVNLDASSKQVAELHVKYLRMVSMAKLNVKRKKQQLAEMRKKKWLYFNGKMTKADMDIEGWPYDPFNGGHKPMKGDLELWYDTDPDMVKITSQLEYQTVILETLIDIMDNIKWRHTHIRNMIDWKKFTSGI